MCPAPALWPGTWFSAGNDFVIIAEADGPESVARLSLEFGLRAGVHTETLQAINVDLLAGHLRGRHYFEPHRGVRPHPHRRRTPAPPKPSPASLPYKKGVTHDQP